MKYLIATIVAVMPLLSALAQFNVTGKVTDEGGEVLPGANVYLENTKYVTSTDGSGRFTLSGITSDDYLLKVSYVGYENYQQRIEVTSNLDLTIALNESVIKAEEVIVYATRANEKTPTTYSNISSKEIKERNLGQDIPFVLKYTPSMVVTSDAGNGVGYTGIRIRGSDPTRINVTVNGIPLNDSESHGVFWVNMPDFTSSVDNIQIQRGVGTSTNGAAAFGATVNLQTDMPEQEPYAQINNSYGSFNTWKHTVELNTGLIHNRWAFQGRASKIASDGYIDRAESDLKSYFLSGGYYGEKTTVKALTFAGREVTYQSWYGTPEAKLYGNEDDLQSVIDFGGEYATQEQVDNLYNSDRRFNYYLYDREVDNYGQDHYQLHLNHNFSSALNVTAALHYTHGEGYFEQYRYDDDFSDYGLKNITYLNSQIYSDSVLESGKYINSQFGSDLLNDPDITFSPVINNNGDTVKNGSGDVLLDAWAGRSESDFIRRRWLDNDFYGGIFSLNYASNQWNVILGGGYNYYDGDHFGEIIWAEYASNSEIREKYYDNYGRKSDFNIYSKANLQIGSKLNLFGDIQLRAIDYKTKGIDSDLRMIDTGGDYLFFNPKVGATYFVSQNSNIYASFAVGNREPVRNDFVDAPDGQTPQHETLRNLEVGYRSASEMYSFSANYYLMDYNNQLVLTGALNDVGSSIRTNVDDSYRMGVELVGGVQITDQLNFGGNLTLSQNKIKEFREVVYDYGVGFDEYNEITIEHQDTDIAFSPNVIAAGQLEYSPLSGLKFQLMGKYVGKQYLDNTSNEDRIIRPYFVSDALANYTFSLDGFQEIGISLMVNNIFNKMYESNGYTWGYYYGYDEGNLYQQNNYYPQAGTNFLASLSLKF